MSEKTAAIKQTISVIIPHLNQGDHLRRCLSSLKNQTGIDHPVEILVVDNGSKTFPTKICNSFDGVRLEREDTPGPGPARNKGIAASTGTILAFIDADCIADPDWIEAIRGVFGKNRSPHIIGGDVRIAVTKPARLTILEAYESIFAYRQKEYIERLGFSGTGNLAMRRECFDTVGPFAGIEIAEDRDWGRRAGTAGYSITYVPEMIVFHPARNSFKDLAVKWDRHIEHDFEEYAQKHFGRAQWIVYALAVAVSPVIEMGRIIRSPRVTAWRDKCLAALCLIRIRFYRVRRMFSRLFTDNQAGGNKAWNRD